VTPESVVPKDWINPQGQRMRRLEMHLSYRCPQRCWFCSEAERMVRDRAYEVTWSRIRQTLRLHAQRGITSLHLTGGEPTVHPRFVDTLSMARRLAMRTSTGTNGYRLGNATLAQAALPLLDEVMFSLHGPEASVHDPQTGTPGSFDRVVKALRLCGDLAPEVHRHVNVVITRANVDRLADTVTLAESLGAQMVLLSNPTPEGAAERCYGKIAADFRTLAQKLPAAADRATKAVIRFFGVPACLLGDHAVLSNDLYWDPRATVEWVHRPGKVVYEAQYNWQPIRRRVHVDVCRDCDWNTLCAGVFDTAAALWPTDALTPMDAR
jgi:MoaA/NifB/PqqE/SkfB family radical SAM enzyme